MLQLPMRRRAARDLAAIAAVVGLTAACTGAPAPSPGDATSSASTTFTIDTPAPTKNAGDVVWSSYTDVVSIDPIYTYNFPDNTALAAMCDSVLRQRNDMSYGDGLATLTSQSDTEFDFTINANAKFWDGNPVTAADAVFSLRRAADPKVGGYFTATFDRVKSIDVTGDKTFKITLSKPDYWLLGELSSNVGAVVEQKFVEAKGKDYGTPTGGIMCSGPLKYDSWEIGKGLKMVPNPDYWDTSMPKPKLDSLTLIPVGDDATLTAGLKTGAIDGSYVTHLSTLAQLQADPNVSVYQGPPYVAPAMIISATKGPLADPRVRQAVSLALDRKGIINTEFHGAANLPNALEAQGTWGTARDTFKTGYDALPVMAQDLAKAQALAKEAGVVGQTVTIGTSSGVPSINALALAFKTACEAVGLKAELQNVSPANYVNYFLDPKAYGSVDAFETQNYGNYADPSALYKTLALPGGSQNFSGWSNPEVTAALESARGEKDETARAQYVLKAQKILTEQLVWIPLVAANNILVMNKKVTGAPATFVYMFGPWAAYLGGA